MPKKKAAKKKRGPLPDRVKIKGDWAEAVKNALGKKRPAACWPENPTNRPAKDDKGELASSERPFQFKFFRKCRLQLFSNLLRHGTKECLYNSKILFKHVACAPRPVVMRV